MTRHDNDNKGMREKKGMKVRKRDGRIEPFDPSKISGAIHKAACTAGDGEELLAEELASVVTLFLEKNFAKGIIPIQDIQEMVERVLMETGHSDIARTFLLFRERRERMNETIQVRESLTDSPEAGALEVDSGESDSISVWSKGRIISALVTEAELPVDMATEIAAEVEEKVFRSGLTRISSSLVRELVDNELFNRGLNRRLLNQSIVGVPGYDLKRLVETGGDQQKSGVDGVSGPVASAVLRQYALRWIYSSEEAEAHLRGSATIEGLDHPNRFLSLHLEPTLLPAPFGGPSPTPSFLSACLRFLDHYVARPLEVEMIDTVLQARAASGVSPGEFAQDFLAAMAAGPVSIQAVSRQPVICLDRSLTDSRLRLLKATGIQGRAATRFMDSILLAFMEAAVKLGREMAIPRLKIDLTGGPPGIWSPPDEELITRAVLMEAGGRLSLAATPPSPSPIAAITPLLGGVDLALKNFLGESQGPIPEEGILAEAQSGLAMALAAIYSKELFMKKLHGKGRGPKAAIRRYLGGNGETIGPGYFRLVPSALLRMPSRLNPGRLNPGRLNPGRLDEGVDKKPSEARLPGLLDRVSEKLITLFRDRLGEEARDAGHLVKMSPPWSHGSRGSSSPMQADSLDRALHATLAWSRYVTLEPVPDFFRGDAADRITYIQLILEGLSKKDHVS